MSKLIKIQTEKTPKEVIEDIKKNASDFDFIIREIFDMASEFKGHGVVVQNNFVYYSIMLCNPEKAYKSILGNPLRGALLLPPKQVVIYKENDSGKTTIAYASIGEDDVKKLFPKDDKFQNGLSESCDKIVKLIKKINEEEEK